MMAILAKPVETVVFESDNILIRHCPTVSDELLVVTFGNLLQQQTKAQPGFGEKLLRDAGISAIHVTCGANRWYQYPEMLRLGDIVAGIRSRYRTVATYGSSMGGYAALLFSGQVRADRVIAASPQFSIDPAKVPFDRTWNHLARDILFINDDIGVGVSGEVFLIYDDKHVDGQHAERIAADVPVHRIVTPHAGHPSVHFLNRAGLLKPMMLDLLQGRHDAAELHRSIRSSRRMSAGHLCALARRGRLLDRRLRLLDRAQELEPQRIEVYAIRGQLHTRAGDLENAAQAFRDGLAANPRHYWSRNWLADVLSRGGHHAEAITSAREAVAGSPGTADFHHTLGLCLTHRGNEPAAARAAFSEAVRLDPGNPRYVRSCDRAMVGDRNAVAHHRDNAPG